MDVNRLDDLSKSLATAKTRRQTVASLGALTLAGLGLLGLSRNAPAAGRRRCIDRCVENAPKARRARERCRRRCENR